MCFNFWFCIDYLMDYGLNGYCLKGLCLGDCCFFYKVYFVFMGCYNYLRRYLKLEGEINLFGGLLSGKFYDIGVGFFKKLRLWVVKRVYLEIWDFSRKCEGCNKLVG